MLTVFLEVVLPVALVAVAGGVIGHWRGVVVTPVSTLAFYLFTPALAFHSLSQTEVSADVSLRLVLVMVVTFAVMYALASGWSLLRGHEASLRAAFALVVLTPNTGNMGLPVSQLAFGEEGLEIAVVVFVTGMVLANSAGISVASTAGGANREALTAPFRYPALYAALMGVVVNVLSIDLPVTLEAPVRSLAGAAIPTMLIVLGLQLKTAAGRDKVGETGALIAAKLALAPAIAWLAAMAVGLDGLNRDTIVVMSAMPTAVIATILATEFAANPAFVTRSVVTTTAVSMLSLTVLITALR